MHLTWGEPPEKVRAKVDRMRSLAEREGRLLRFGLRAHVITRDTSEQAWRVAQDFLEQMDPADVAAAQAKLAKSESTGQGAITGLHGGELPDSAR